MLHGSRTNHGPHLATRASESEVTGSQPVTIERYLHECRDLTLTEIRHHVPRDSRETADLYRIMLDYPLRPAKALRPALCIATARALGGNVDSVLPSAAAFELYHNAFLIHDDVEDQALQRRHAPALHVKYGVPIAINVGDAMLAAALGPLLHNTQVLGLGPALRILTEFARMARESVEGQMLELSWVQHKRWDLTDREYVRMVHKKTGWYSFIAPMRVGALAAGAPASIVDRLGRFALSLGVAFQIHDDLLSLESVEATTGKDTLGDLWEGKYTLALLHALRTMSPAERSESLAILARPQPTSRVRRHADDAARRALLGKIQTGLVLDAEEQALLVAALGAVEPRHRTCADVERLFALVTGRGGASLQFARSIASRHAQLSQRHFNAAGLEPSIHRSFLEQVVSYVTQRTH